MCIPLFVKAWSWVTRLAYTVTRLRSTLCHVLLCLVFCSHFLLPVMLLRPMFGMLHQMTAIKNLLFVKQISHRESRIDYEYVCWNVWAGDSIGRRESSACSGRRSNCTTSSWPRRQRWKTFSHTAPAFPTTSCYCSPDIRTTWPGSSSFSTHAPAFLRLVLVLVYFLFYVVTCLEKKTFPEADWGMCSMFGRTAAPQARECRTAGRHYVACEVFSVFMACCDI